MTEDKNKSLVQQRREREVLASSPTIHNPVDPDTEYINYLNESDGQNEQNGSVATLPQPKATPMGVVDVNGVSDGRYASGMKELTNLVGAESLAMSPEEEQRRMKRAHTAAMIGNLGNVMSAFANLYYVDKGAPSQKTPEGIVPDYMSFQDRVSQARRNAANEQLQRERLLADMKYKDDSLAQRKRDADIRERKLVMEEQKLDWKKQYDQGILDIKAEINRINDMKTRGQIDRWEAQNYTDYLKALTGQQNADTNAAREGRLAGGQTIEETDELGNKKTKVVTPNKTASSNGQGSGSNGGGGAPPSRGGSNNTPPSKQSQRKAPPSRRK